MCVCARVYDNNNNESKLQYYCVARESSFIHPSYGNARARACEFPVARAKHNRTSAYKTRAAEVSLRVTSATELNALWAAAELMIMTMIINCIVETDDDISGSSRIRRQQYTHLCAPIYTITITITITVIIIIGVDMGRVIYIYIVRTEIVSKSRVRRDWFVLFIAKNEFAR